MADYENGPDKLLYTVLDILSDLVRILVYNARLF